MSLRMSVRHRSAAVVIGMSAAALFFLLWPAEVRHSAPFGRSLTLDARRAIAVRGGYVTPNYDDFDRVDLDLRAYSPGERYDLTIHIRPATAPDVPDVRTVPLVVDAEEIWHQKEAFADPFVTVTFPAIEDSAGRLYFVWVEAGPRNRDDIWTLWSVKTFSTVRPVEVLAAFVDEPPTPIRVGGGVVLILLIAGTVGSAVWLMAAVAAVDGAGLNRQPAEGNPDSVAAAKG